MLFLESSKTSSFQNTTTASNITYSNDAAIVSPSKSSTTAAIPTASTATPIPSAGSTPTLSASMGFQGRNIPECCCSFCEIEQVNTETVSPLLKKIVETPFFSHFKIDLCSSCELWEDAPLCRMKDCSVCECDEPPSWSFENVPELPPTGPDCSSVADDNVVTTVDSKVLNGWIGNTNTKNPFGSSFITDGEETPEDSSSISTAQVVDLLKNPEGYTGYTGPSAEKVWSAVHSQNCFQQPSDTQQQKSTEDGNADEINDDENKNDMYCFLPSEQRLYNRFISGLHSSISLHIAHSYCLEMDPHEVGECRTWGLNDQIAYDRVLSHPDRVENLYVAFSLLLRAVIKAEVAIAAAVPAEDPVLEESLNNWREDLLPELLALPQKAPATFDESSLVFGAEFRDSSRAKRSELQRRFRQLQSIVQCVGCDRCKLWGTLQTLGVGTALKVLFHDDDDGSSSSIYLSRQEAVALVNTLERLSSSLVFAQEFRVRRETMKLFDRDSSCSSAGSS